MLEETSLGIMGNSGVEIIFKINVKMTAIMRKSLHITAV